MPILWFLGRLPPATSRPGPIAADVIFADHEPDFLTRLRRLLLLLLVLLVMALRTHGNYMQSGDLRWNVNAHVVI